MPIVRRVLMVGAACLVASAGLRAQNSAAPIGPRNVEVEPIRCWWKTSTGAVRIGEQFSVVLTCAVLQNEAVQVKVDESRLGSAVAQMPPFEIVHGSHPDDLYSADRRFFQYEYTLRIINPDLIGKDARIPDQLVHYRVDSRMAENASLQGRDHPYVMPGISMRVLGMVPADAADIRDATDESFGLSQSLNFRADVLEIVAITAAVLGALFILVSLVRLIVRTRKQKPAADRGIGEPRMLKEAVRELSAVQQESEARGWNEGLLDRALAASRLAASAAIGRTAGQRQTADAAAGEGRLLLSTRRGPVALSGSATTSDVTSALNRLPDLASADRRQILEDLRTALAAFTSAQYARELAFDRGELDDAVGRASVAAGRLRSEHAWPKPYLRRFTRRAPEAGRA